MNEADYNDLRESSWQRELTPAEAARLEQYLDAHPEARPDWQADAVLTQMLDRLPQAPPVASNFTAQVLLGVKRDSAKASAANGWFTWRGVRSWLPRMAVACLVAGVATVSYRQHEIKSRELLAQNVSELAQAVIDPALIEDMEPIQRLSDSQPKADLEVIALMQSK